jgi:hypothetical protein
MNHNPQKIPRVSPYEIWYKLRQSVIKNVCGNAATRSILDIGGSFRYLYADIEAKPVMTIDIVQRTCS